MASDEIVWQIINQQFCSYKLKTEKGNNFCRNEYNVTGLCSRQSCPLANSRSATVRADPIKGRLYLYIKTVERCHTPARMWEKIRLPNNYQKLLEMVDEKLQFWPKFWIHKCKQRATRLTQINIRMRRIAAEEARLGEKLVPKMAPKIRNREAKRERKAEAAARVEKVIERELIERLRNGAYGDAPLNVSETIWQKVLRGLEREGDATRDKDLDEGIEDEQLEDAEAGEEDELEDDLEQQVEYVSDFDESEEDVEDIEDWLASGDEEADDDDDEDEVSEAEAKQKGKAKAGDKRKRGRVVRMAAKKKRETEVEQEGERQRLALAW